LSDIAAAYFTSADTAPLAPLLAYALSNDTSYLSNPGKKIDWAALDVLDRQSAAAGGYNPFWDTEAYNTVG